jgi:hypothetical protein
VSSGGRQAVPADPPSGHGLACSSAVSCRIDVLEEHGVRVVRVEGRLTEAHTADLLAVCLEPPRSLRIDLSGLSSADGIAVEALRRLQSDGIELTRIPRYLEFTLRH